MESTIAGKNNASYTHRSTGDVVIQYAYGLTQTKLVFLSLSYLLHPNLPLHVV